MALDLQVINDGLWDYDVVNDEVFFNSKYYTMLGYEPYELPQSRQTWIDLLHPDDREKSVCYVDECINAQKEWLLEFRLRRKKGGYRWILGAAMLLFAMRKGVRFAGSVPILISPIVRK